MLLMELVARGGGDITDILSYSVLETSRTF
jgi:hypothetical protein